MSKKIRILQLTTDSALGGAEHLLAWIAGHYDRAGFEMVFCTLRPRGLLHELLEKEGQAAFSLDFGGPGNLPAGTRRLKNITASFAPDIIHSHLLYAGLLANWLYGKGDTPLLVHTRHYGNYYAQFGNPALRYLDRYLMRRSPLIIAVSQAVEQLLVHEMGISSKRIKQIYNGVDIDWLSREKGNVAKTQGPGPRIGLVGNFDRCKGHDLVLSIAPQLLESFPTAQFIFVGDGARKPVIQAEIAQAQLEKYFSLPGFVPEIAALLESLDLVLMPSRSEGFGLVACEALALGVPLVASRTEALKEIVEHEVSGLLFDKNNAGDFLLQIKRMLTDVALRTRCIENGRKQVKERFDIHLMVDKLQNLYREMFNGRAKN